MKNKIILSLYIALFAFVILPTAALAVPTPVTYHFNVVQTGVSQDVIDIIYDNLFVIVDKENGGKASFTFKNSGDTPAEFFVATSLYFMDVPPILDASTGVILFEQGVDYELTDKKNPNLPAGNTIGFEPTGGYDPLPPSPTNGLGPGDVLKIQFDFAGAYGIGDLIKALNGTLNDGTLDIGMHVQAIGAYGGNSLSVHLNGNGGGGPGPGPEPIPEPATMLLLGTGLVGLAGTARRRKKLQK